MASDRRFGSQRRNRMSFGRASRARHEAGPFHLRRLVLCPGCGWDFVAVISAEQTDEGGPWAMVLRCGACEAQRSVLASSGELDRLLDELDWDALQLEADAEQLWRERTADEIEIFAWALERGLIGTDDFER
jgi:hypothetical protein